MKKVEIRQFTHAEVDAPKETFGFLKVPIEHNLIRAEGEDLEVSDGYHTMDELYKHRIVLYIALCRQLQAPNGPKVWRSRLHSDGSSYEGWFIMGVGDRPGKQITYHIPLEYWVPTNFAIYLEKAPEFDGHTSADVLERIEELFF